jgi:hypothetical protein
MSRVIALAATVAATGCFYTGEINERPATELTRILPAAPPYRGDMVTVAVSTVDPDGDPVDVTWTATACSAGAVACEPVPYDTGRVNPGLRKIDVVVKDAVTTRSIRLVARSVDSRGAPALQDEVLDIDVANYAPVVDFQIGTIGPPSGPTRITASATDADDELADLAFTDWSVMTPAGSSSTGGALDRLGDNADVPGRDSADETYELIPDVEGVWTVRVTVTDPIGTATTVEEMISIGPDRPPCIADVAPLAPPPGNTLTFDQLRRFSVLVVTDDLDVYPAPPLGDPYLGPATFTWFLASPASGDAFVPLSGAIDNFVELDPLAFDPGDHVRLRVEVADRVSRTLPCLPDAPTCAIAMPSCIQRQTWALEVR